METCAGCDQTTNGTFPFVGVTHNKKKVFHALPVCRECHTDPTHRKRVLKMAYFDRAQADEAVFIANHNARRPKGAPVGVGAPVASNEE